MDRGIPPCYRESVVSPMKRRRRWLYILPNAFTVSSIFCGFYSITLSAGEATSEHLYKAALAVFFAIFFDGFDGRVARLTNTASDFGVQLDSLADVISFGVAPALLVYKWALAPFGLLGMAIACTFACCGALRLARFNVLAQSGEGSNRFFVGLPIPLAAGMIVSLVIAHERVLGGEVQGNGAIAALVLVLSYLMVSNVRYRTFKDAHWSKRSAAVFVLVCLAGVAVAMAFKPPFVLVAYFSAYIVLGLVEEIVFFKRRRAEAVAQASSPSGALVATDDDEEEEDEEEGYI